MQTLILPANLDQTIGQLKAQYQSQLISGKNPNPLLYLNPWLPNTVYGSLSPVKAFYDVNEDRIELDPIVVKGGYIELVGEIISTGTERSRSATVTATSMLRTKPVMTCLSRR
jgi:hypothetical protein